MGNLTRKKRKRDERSFVVSDSVIVGDRGRTEYETSLDAHQQAVGPPIAFMSWVGDADFSWCRLEDLRRLRIMGR